jgi:beta-galactosidase
MDAVSRVFPTFTALTDSVGTQFVFRAVAVLLYCILVATTARSADSHRERTLFDDGWQFTKDDPPGTGDQLSYPKIRDWVVATGNDFLDPGRPMPARPAGNLGGSVAYTQPEFDDSGWRRIDLPHDWGVEGPFRQNYPGDTGKLPWWGIGWYRKHFAASVTDGDSRLYLDIDGAMAYANVWLNGHFVGGWPYGYASWRLDLTPWLNTASDNVLAIRLDNPPDSSRWYPGGGIYRNVWLVKTASVHIAQWGTYVTTPTISENAATVYIEATVENDTGIAAGVQVSTSIYELDAAGNRAPNPIANADPTPESAIVAGSQVLLSQALTVVHPKLWDLKAPNRYVAVTTVMQAGKLTDRYETPFGIRSIAFTAAEGFILNGRHVPIQGVCDHHDLGALGSALNVRALERQLEILREMGCNAIRTSHNPPAPELLELCDRLGFVVMDETFDCWQVPKRPNDYHLLFADWHEKDVRALVRRDRNHPSVILWSIGNEIPEQLEPEGWKLASHLSAIVHEEDRTRPTISACNKLASGYNGFQVALDVLGYNYKPGAYLPFRQANPQIPVLGSETSSTVSSRGEYFFPVGDDKASGRADFQVSSYDLYAPPWANTPDVEFRGLDGTPFAAGEFVWTGFDYLGEPTPYNTDVNFLMDFTDPVEKAAMQSMLARNAKIEVPSRSSYFGIVDLAGFKKDRFFLYQARWRPDLKMAHILPHWNWPDRVGKVTPVHVYTSGDEAELFLNGNSLGRKKRGPFEYRLRWDNVVYQPGELKVIAYKNGERWADDIVKTTGLPAVIKLSADRAALSADGRDLSFVTVAIADQKGLTVPGSKNHVTFTIDGPGEIVATDNGDPTCLEPFQEKVRSAFNGLALVIVRTEKDKPGTITLKAASEGLDTAEVPISSIKPL